MKSIIKLKSIDWQFYLERKATIFYVSLYFEVYKNLLLKVAGFSFKEQLFLYKNGYIANYRSKKQMQEARKYFFELVKQNDPRVKLWFIEGKKLLQKESKFIEEIKKMTPAETVNQYGSIIEQCQQFFLYLTGIPFLILNALETGPRNHKNMIEKYLIFRKESRAKLQETVFEKIWQGVSEKIGQDWKDISYLTFSEVDSILHDKKYPKEEIEKRKKGGIYFLGESQAAWLYGENLLQKVGINREEYNLEEIKGHIAYKGLVQGKVCILNREGDMRKFKERNVIVSINTAPTLTPAIRKCKAIVTDEGGLTSHAAIIARELKIPCIIGTKFATKVLKDGDLVEVDANKGIVRKLR